MSRSRNVLRFGAIFVPVAAAATFATSHGLPPTRDASNFPASLCTLLHLLPHKTITAASTALLQIPLPTPLRAPLYEMYAPRQRPASEADLPLQSYSSLRAFMDRQQSIETRPTAPSRDAAVVAPVDAYVAAVGPLGPSGVLPWPQSNNTVQCSARDVLAAEPLDPIVTSPSAQLYALVLHVPPRECHRFVSPAEWSVSRATNIPGGLTWVNVPSDPSAYATNERTVWAGSWDHGFFGIVAIGGCGQPRLSALEAKAAEVEQIATLTRGQRRPGFAVGAALIVLFEAPDGFNILPQPGDFVLAGQPIAVAPVEPKPPRDTKIATASETKAARRAASARQRRFW